MDTLYVVMPAYNEEENIEEVVSSWYPVLEGKSPESRLVVADAGSKDKTQIDIISDTGTFHGPKVIALYNYAIANGADYIFQTDSDGQTLPEEFGAFWEMRSAYKGIFGHRKVRGDGKSRAFVEKVVCFLIKLFFGVKVPDANAPFRLMNAQTVAKYIGRLDKDYNLPNIMMTTYFAYYKEDMIFKEVTFRPRQGGTNSINIKKIIKIGWKALKDFHDLKKAM